MKTCEVILFCKNMRSSSAVYLYLLANFICLFSCCNNSIYTSDVNCNLISIVNLGNQQHKCSLLFFSESEKSDYFDEFSKKMGNTFVCYKDDPSLRKIFEKIFGFNINIPVCVVLSGDSIFHIVAYSKGKIPQECDVNEKCKTSASFQIGNKAVLKKDINDTFRKKLFLERISEDEILEVNKSDISSFTMSSFYNRYLTACLFQYIGLYDDASVILNKLWQEFTSKETELYKEELIDVMERIRKLPIISNDSVKFENMSYNFGLVSSKCELSHSFLFENISSHKMLISDIITSCGCTLVSWNKDVINPGQVDSVVVVLKTDQTGFIMKDVSIICNTEYMIKLRISATITEF